MGRRPFAGRLNSCATMKCVAFPTQGDAKGVSVLGSSCNSNMTVDVVIVGAGPAGIFTALALLKDAPSTTIALVEKGLPIERRNCPKAKVGHCVGCEPCRITTGFSGAGAFSDGKLSLSHEVGGDLPELIGEDVAQAAIKRVDDAYLSFGADRSEERHV